LSQRKHPVHQPARICRRHSCLDRPTLCRHRDPPRATTPFVTPQESVDESVVNRAQANARIGDRISRDSRVSLTLRIVPKTKEQICTEEAMREAERNERLWYQSISEPSRAM
jgi:hypothetical protein